VGPRDGLHGFWRLENLLSLARFESRTAQPVADRYRLQAIPTPIKVSESIKTEVNKFVLKLGWKFFSQILPTYPPTYVSTLSQVSRP
jgi:hypothetical protein